MAVAVILIGLVLFFRDQAIITFLEKEKDNEKKLYFPHEYTCIKSKEEKKWLYKNQG